jgi:hypothetical protein
MLQMLTMKALAAQLAGNGHPSLFGMLHVMLCYLMHRVENLLTSGSCTGLHLFLG